MKAVSTMRYFAPSVVCLVVVGCGGSKHPIVGGWQATEPKSMVDWKTTYEFQPDNTMSMIGNPPGEKPITVKAVYELTDKDKLTLKFKKMPPELEPSMGKEWKREFEIAGDTLTVVDPEQKNKTMKFKRVK
jgi:hypothetical protein